MKDFERIRAGWYRSVKEPRVELKTYCECGRNCMGHWAVYVDDQVYGYDFFAKLNEAKQRARIIVASVTA